MLCLVDTEHIAGIFMSCLFIESHLQVQIQPPCTSKGKSYQEDGRGWFYCYLLKFLLEKSTFGGRPRGASPTDATAVICSGN